jgi:hypothetical protein
MSRAHGDNPAGLYLRPLRLFRQQAIHCKMSSQRNAAQSHDSDHGQWIAKISAIQREKIGSKEWDEMVEQSEMMRSSVRACAKSCSATSRLREIKTEVQTSLDAMSHARQLRAQSVSSELRIEGSYEQISRQTEFQVLQSSREETEEAELSRWNAERQQILSGAAQVPQLGETALSLEEFRSIPSDDEEEAAKFRLYETFAQACEQIRGQLFAFYDSNKSNLGPRVRAAMERTLAEIDRAENLGVAEPDEHTWFVLGMAVRVDANATMLMRVLADFGRRMEMIAAEGQSCPVCLEGFEAEVSPRAVAVHISHGRARVWIVERWRGGVMERRETEI